MMLYLIIIVLMNLRDIRKYLFDMGHGIEGCLPRLIFINTYVVTRKQMLRVLGLGFIVNYDASPKSVRKENTLGFALDMVPVSTGVCCNEAK